MNNLRDLSLKSEYSSMATQKKSLRVYLMMSLKNLISKRFVNGMMVINGI